MSLIEDAKAARKAGMTYGQYMVTKKPSDRPRKTKQEKNICLNCGGSLPPDNRKFCSMLCRSAMAAKNKNGGAFT